ncbi:(E,E)-geranyllinalool synthase [Cardamine amara subsp. amara]|uniref:(E,E)-geranyllinalool synthase n=1 Tax=Cardamine amara subsp. amara TaxID=228776 RepID=A0ABD1AVK6_CARAN
MKFDKCFTSELYSLADEIKRETFEFDKIKNNPYSFVSPSAYDTAWLAMIEDVDTQKPMFQGCLDWILSNQNVVEGIWGSHGDENGDETLTSTLACVVALRKWKTGSLQVRKGKRYIERSTEMIIGKYINPKKKGSCPRWLVLMFTGLLELAQQLGLQFLFSARVNKMINNLFFQRQEILHREKLMDDRYNQRSLLAYLEVLPSTLYTENQEEIIEKLCDFDGSLFQSPSATAAAFMLSGNTKCLAYLQSLVQRCPHGVPQIYPMSEELIKLSMVNIMDNFGLGEFLSEEIDHFLLHIYKSYKTEDVERMPIFSKVDQLHKASLEFRMLRMNGYNVLPKSFCWFLSDEEIRDHLEKNIECLFFVMLSVYRATDLIFPEECELEEAREFSRKLLGKRQFIDEQMVLTSHIKHEISTPWMARLKHLDHRMWIEGKDSNAFSVGKASLIRINSDKLTHLAVRNFELRQAVYRSEMDDLMKWVKKSGLKDIGFGREKTTYCYFAASSSTSLPFKSAANIRKLMAKSGILITVADDFFDEEGSVDELKALTKAVLRWEGEELKDHGKIIFQALDNIVKETAETCLKGHGTDITDHLRNIWNETFESWLREANWNKKGHIPSMEEYLRNGMISIAAHTIALPTSYLMESCFPQHKLKPGNYDTITTLLMTITRLLNDLQSYQKEQEQGKINSVLLHMRNHCGFEIEDSIAHIEKIIDSKRKQFMEHVLMDEFNELPKPCKDIHMSLCKVFEMFFNKKNRYDSDMDMVQDIKKALYDPINIPK